MKVDLSKYFDESEVYFKFRGQMDESEISFDNRNIELSKPIKYEVEVFTLEDFSREINIVINYTYKEPCSRCLKPTERTVETILTGELIEGKEEDYEDFTSEDDDEIEYLIFYENNKLDIGHYVETQIDLSMPMQTLCSKDCKGLCSMCGNDLNKDDCDCEHDDIDPRLEKLKDFIPDD